jgi:hypothetical protein
MAETNLSWEGIQLVWVIMGVIGAALGIGAMPKMSNRECWVALGSGLVFSGYGPQWANHAYVHWAGWVNPAHDPMPNFMLGSVAFVCGVGGLFLIPAILAFYRDPRGFISKVLQLIKGVKVPPLEDEERKGEA